MAGICIVFPVEFEGSAPDSHLTNIFLGPIEEADFTRTSVQRVVDRLRKEWLTAYPDGHSVTMTEYDHFGPQKDVLVFLPQYHPFNYFRELAEEDLEPLGVESASEFEYRAHITAPANWDLKAQGVPTSARIGAPVLWWGKDRPANTVTGEKVINVKSEHTVETHHFSRHIKLEKGPKMVTRKNIRGVQTQFRAKELVINWRHGEEPTHVIVYGKTGGVPNVACRRIYKMAKAPRWIKDLL